MSRCFVVIILSLLAFVFPALSSTLDSLGIVVASGSREFAYTNKATAFYYGETHDANRSSWQGFNVFGHEYLDDYLVLVDDIELDRTQSIVTVFPDYLRRVYPNGIIEELRLVDERAILSITIRSPRKAAAIEILPLVTDGSSLQDFVVGHREHALVMARKAHQQRSPSSDYPVWIAMSGPDFEADHETHRFGGQFAPFSLKFEKKAVHTVAFAVGDSPREADSLLQYYFENKDALHSARRQRMETLLESTRVTTADKRFDKALAWAKLSLDALVMNRITTGIFAGLPWFNNYWGRDTFISLPGATLVTGQFPVAKAILRSFCEFQQIDSTSSDYGRIPNLVTTTSKAYNTADGTPRFIMMAKDYVIRSGDTSFMLEVYPAVIRSIQGTIRYHTDAHGFLTHKDAETWMDAVGPDGPWSPRGNRACDIQALWAQQLEAGNWFATELGDVRSASEWDSHLQRLRKDFVRAFATPSGLADHLNSDGTQDGQIRPNQIFCGAMVGDSLRTSVLKTVTSRLTYEYGVASLAQTDPRFHPYHQHDPFYPKDAAYHNGTVWTWVQGAVISELCRFGKQELAASITGNSVHQILDRDAVGTQSELLDAIPHPGNFEPFASGTFSQAWNLAEFVRNFYEDYLGVSVDRYHHVLTVRPALPKQLGIVHARINLGGRFFEVTVNPDTSGPSAVLSTPKLISGGTGIVMLPYRGNDFRIEFPLKSETTFLSGIFEGIPRVSVNGKLEPSRTSSQAPKHYPSLNSLRLLRPLAMPDSLPVCRGPLYPLLSNLLVKRDNPHAKLFIDTTDPERDDTGKSGYTYPTHPYFVHGIFDLRRFTVKYDDTLAYFRLSLKSLSNPGWHPEYGFQLTYIAIALNRNGKPGTGSTDIGHNSSYVLDARHAFQRLIIIGGGVRIEEKNGAILAAYIPTPPDIAHPLGNIETGEISFALPLKYLGKPDPHWQFTVLVGAQDDHGGAGIGEFRSVTASGGEWDGAGKMNPNDPNIYDILVATPK